MKFQFKIRSLNQKFKIDENYTWRYFNKLHFTYGPAYVHYTNAIVYAQNGMLHRLDGPARILPDGRKEYWIYGNNHNKITWLEEARDKISQ